MIADYGNNLVRIVNLNSGQVNTIAGNTNYYDDIDRGENVDARNASVSHPQGVVYDSIGNLYVTTAIGYVRKIDPTGVITTFAGSSTSSLLDQGPALSLSLSNPTGLAIDNNKGVLYVADTGHHRVLKVDIQTQYATTVAGIFSASDSKDGQLAAIAGLNAPTWLGLDPQGNLLIADSGNNKIKRVVFQSSSTGVLSYLKSDNLGKGARYNPDGSWVPDLVRNSDTTWTRNYRNGTVVNFDQNGNQVTSSDRVGNTSQYSYDTYGRVISITDSTGRSITYSYSGANLSSITDPAGRTTLFNYDATNNLTRVVFPDKSAKQFFYDENGVMIAEQDQMGAKIYYTYNGYNRLISATRDDGTSVTVNDSGSGTAGVPGATVAMQALGTEPNGTQDQVQDANGNTTSYAKNAFGFISKVTDPTGQVTTIIRDVNGLPTKIIRPDGTYEAFVYDIQTGDLLSHSDSRSGTTVTQTFDAYGNKLSFQNPRGFAETTTFNQLGLPISKTNYSGYTLQFSYSSFGQIVSRTDAAGNISTASYDAAGNLTAIKDPAGRIVMKTYDAAGNVTSISDPNGNRTVYEYDVFNRMTSATTPKGERTEYSYSPGGQLVQVKDALGKLTTFAYDSRGNLVRMTDPLGNITTRSYDANNNIIQEVDPSGNVKTYTYNNFNKLIQKMLPDNIISLSYDQYNRLVQISDNLSSITYSYDTSGRISNVVTQGNGALASMPQGSVSYMYDANGNKVARNTSVGNFAYQFDTSDQLTSVTNPWNEVYSITYDNLARPVSLSRPGSRSDYTFDHSSFLSGITHSAGSAALLSVNYSRDLAGNITQTTNDVSTKLYSYDQDNQVTSATNPEAPSSSGMSTETFSYDPISNRSADQGGQYVYDSTSQRLTEDYRYLYFYDKNGNLTTKQAKGSFQEVTKYSYSSENRLIAIRVYRDGSNSPVKVISYYYDALGRRIGKDVMDYSAQNDPTKTFSRRFIYDDGEILAEYDGSNRLLTTYTHTYRHSDETLAANVTSDGVSAGVALQSGSYGYLKDTIGSIVGVVRTDGTLVQKYVYSVFGKILAVTDSNANDISTSPAINTPFTYANRELDSESGLYFNRARYYDASIGRFLQEDPEPGQLEAPISVVNRYIYGANNPNQYTDPSGRFIQFLLAIGMAIALSPITIGAVIQGLSTRDWSIGNLVSGSLKMFSIAGAAVTGVGIIGVTASTLAAIPAAYGAFDPNSSLFFKVYAAIFVAAAGAYNLWNGIDKLVESASSETGNASSGASSNSGLLARAEPIARPDMISGTTATDVPYTDFWGPLRNLQQCAETNNPSGLCGSFPPNFWLPCGVGVAITIYGCAITSPP